MLNRIIIIGRLARDVDLRYTASDMAVAKFTLAVARKVSKGKEKEADFIDAIAWGRQAEVCEQYLGKGSLVAVEGRLQIRSYDNKEGKRVKAAEVVAETVKFLDSKKSGNGGGGADNRGNAGTGYDDDIPF